jgi:hypothetical protein
MFVASAQDERRSGATEAEVEPRVAGLVRDVDAALAGGAARCIARAHAAARPAARKARGCEAHASGIEPRALRSRDASIEHRAARADGQRADGTTRVHRRIAAERARHRRPAVVSERIAAHAPIAVHADGRRGLASGRRAQHQCERRTDQPRGARSVSKARRLREHCEVRSTHRSRLARRRSRFGGRSRRPCTTTRSSRRPRTDARTRRRRA